MEERPRVTVLLLTYEDGKRNTAERTLRAALDGLRYSGELHIHIADDGSQEGHVDALAALAGGYAHVASVGRSDAARRGYGASYNLATQQIHKHGGAVLVLEDDWELTRPLDLDPLVAALAEPGIGTIRLGYLGHTQPLYGEVTSSAAGAMLALAGDSPEPHISAGHPRLETVAQQQRIGPWDEGVAPGATEMLWCRRPEARDGVVWPLDLGPASMRSDSLFAHIGSHGLGEVEPEG